MRQDHSGAAFLDAGADLGQKLLVGPNASTARKHPSVARPGR